MRKIHYILIVVVALLFASCQKRPELKVCKLEITEETVAVTPNSATVTAHYSYPGEILHIKVFTSLNSNMSGAIEADAMLYGNTMTATFNNLNPDTRYFYRFRYSNGMEQVYTDAREFTTEPEIVVVVVPILTTIPAASITTNSAVTGGNVSDDGGAEVIARGVCYSKHPNPTLEDAYTTDGTGIGSFISTLTHLEANTLYYVKAYATNSNGTGYGDEITFTTTLGLPVVTTVPPTNITNTTAISGGSVIDDSGSAVTARGVCWSVNQHPTVDDAHTSNGVGIGEFASVMMGLAPGTTYHLRAYATNSNGTGYGEEVIFTTVGNK